MLYKSALTWLGFVGFALVVFFSLNGGDLGPKQTHINNFSSSGSKKQGLQTRFSSKVWARTRPTRRGR